MKRFVLSTFSVMLAVSAIAAPSAQAFPQGDSSFNLHTLRLREFDTRNKSEEAEPYYPYTQAPAQKPAQTSERTSGWTTPQDAAAEEERVVESEAIAPQSPTAESASATSITERRQQFLDRS